VGWGEVINGGFGMVMDGSSDAALRAASMLHWDVCNGVTRRAWAGNDNGIMTAGKEMLRTPTLNVTMPTIADEFLLNRVAGIAQRHTPLDLLLTNCRVATMAEDTADYGLLEGVCIGVRDGCISFIGKRVDLPASEEPNFENERDMKSALVTPGLIDCHTHVVYGGDRSSEWQMRLNGATYEEVAQAAGGITNTVTATRASSVEALVEAARLRVQAMLKEGVTTLEIKSGYGLELDAERRMLQARTYTHSHSNTHTHTHTHTHIIQAADAICHEFNVSTVKTFLGTATTQPHTPSHARTFSHLVL
jgi:hypothetical protein